MFSFSFGTRRVAALFGICVALQLGAAFAAPAEFEGLGQKARDVLADLTPMARPVEVRDLEARATPAAPHFVVYADQYQSGVTGPPAVSAVTVRIRVFLWHVPEVLKETTTYRASMSCEISSCPSGMQRGR